MVVVWIFIDFRLAVVTIVVVDFLNGFAFLLVDIHVVELFDEDVEPVDEEELDRDLLVLGTSAFNLSS